MSYLDQLASQGFDPEAILRQIVGGGSPQPTSVGLDPRMGQGSSALSQAMSQPQQQQMPQGQLQPAQPGILSRFAKGADEIGSTLMAIGSKDPNIAFDLLERQKAARRTSERERLEANRPKITPLANGAFTQITFPDGRPPQIIPNEQVQQFLIEDAERKNTYKLQGIDYKANADVNSANRKNAGNEQIKTAGDTTQTGLAVTELTDIANSLDKTDTATGPYVGLLPKVVRDIATPEGAALQDRAERIIQASLRATLGAQFTEKEGARFLERAYNPRQSEAENAKRLRMIATELSSIQGNKEAALAYMKQKGTLDGFVESLSAVPQAPGATAPMAVPGLSPGASKYFQ